MTAIINFWNWMKPSNWVWLYLIDMFCLGHGIFIYMSSIYVLQFLIVSQACASLQEGYLPPVTFVVVQKRHHTRFFPVDRQTDRSGNIMPGFTFSNIQQCYTLYSYLLCWIGVLPIDFVPIITSMKTFYFMFLHLFFLYFSDFVIFI